VTPGLKTTLDGLHGTLAAADGVLKNTDATIVGKDAPGQQELRDALQEIARAARSLRVLTDFLERHPEALLRGKTEGKPWCSDSVSVQSVAPSLSSWLGAPPRRRRASTPSALRLRLPRHHPTCRWSWARCRCRPWLTARRSSSARARTRCRWTSSISGRRRCRTISRAWSPKISWRCWARRM